MSLTAAKFMSRGMPCATAVIWLPNMEPENIIFMIPAKAGASCFECHMPKRTYMQIDPRRDHSIRIPRPDLSDKLGTPNACNQCHTDKSTKWATSYLQKWYGEDLLAQYHYGETFYKARRNDPQAQPELVKLASDKGYSPMVRATALYLLGRYPAVEVTDLLSQTISDPIRLYDMPA